MLTHARLLELVHYDPATGIFTARMARPHVQVGQRLGEPDDKGYLRARILGKRYRLHRLAWFYMTGQWVPEVDHRNRVPEVDHRNRKRADNRWANLREATRQQNVVNSDLTNKITGTRGVDVLSPRRDGRPRYRARLQGNGVLVHLGVFDTAEEAHAAYVRAAKAAYGEFAEHL